MLTSTLILLLLPFSRCVDTKKLIVNMPPTTRARAADPTKSKSPRKTKSASKPAAHKAVTKTTTKKARAPAKPAGKRTHPKRTLDRANVVAALQKTFSDTATVGSSPRTLSPADIQAALWKTFGSPTQASSKFANRKISGPASPQTHGLLRANAVKLQHEMTRLQSSLGVFVQLLLDLEDGDANCRHVHWSPRGAGVH